MDTKELTSSLRALLKENDFVEKELVLKNEIILIDIYKDNINHVFLWTLLVTFYEENGFTCLWKDGIKLIYQKEKWTTIIRITPYFTTDEKEQYTFYKNNGGILLRLKYA